ncbi:hypothetical protein ODJ79_22245 [Actinoplanes sp. KI2]|uniref:hypothetical protein n=1 Tax=Actinoplanes sp. KI2 TaxID=2983315 RepID=UPI0021D5E08C|nr:hypothetical protein [Actinoplanes sp. KI2]MCU7726461.1 hypothetical protein [Actinoplanes sp. KI2]
MSAIGLEEEDRRSWPQLRERLRRPGHLMALMRGVLGDVEVAAVVAVTPAGEVEVLAVRATAPEIAQEITFDDVPEPEPGPDGLAVRPATIGGYPIQVITEPDGQGRPRPLAVLSTRWIDQHLLLYARTLWHRRRR